MRKGLDIAGQDPQLVELFTQLNTVSKDADTRMKFLKKQALDIAKDVETKSKYLWQQVEDRLRERGKLPEDYSKDKNTLHYDKGTGLVSMSNKDDEGEMPEFLKHMLRGMIES